MTVTINDHRTEIDQADTVTNWTGSVSPATFTTEPDPIELTAHLGQVISKTSGWVYATNQTINGAGSGVMVYVWALSKGSPLTKSAGGIGVVIGDGTDLVGYHLAGGDEAGFRHNIGNPYYQCLLIDTSKLATFTNKLVWTGTDTLTMTALTDFGTEWDVGTAKAVGGVANCFTDAIRVGNSGLFVEGGTSGAPGTFAEIAIEDASTADTKAYGVCRELSTGLYGLQGPLKFGDQGTAADSYFDDSSVVVVFEDREVSDDKYKIIVEGASAQTNSFVLSDSTIKSANPAVECLFNRGNVNTLTLDTVAFADLRYPVRFSNLADATGHTVTNCSFLNCGQIDPGDVTFSNNTIANSATSITGAMLIDADGTNNISGTSFISGGTGHAIYIATSGYYTLTDYTYSGYGTTGTTDAAIYNNSGGSCSLTISGGDTPTYRNGTAADTTIIASVPISVKVIDEAGDPIENAQVAIYDATDTQLMNEDTLATGFATEAYSGTTPATVNLRVRKSSAGTTKYIPSSTSQIIAASIGLSVTVTLIEDTNNNS